MDWRKRSRFVCVIWAIVVVGLTCVSPSYAQSTTDGAIGGTVTDQSNAVLPGVSVTVRNIATNSSAEAVTDGVGRFLVIRLQPGIYSVTASLDGFSSSKQENVVVEVGRTTSIDVSLGIAGQAETVVVTGAVANHQHRAVGLLNEHQSDGHRQFADEHTPVVDLRAHDAGSSAGRKFRPGELPRHFRALEQQHRRRRRQYAGLFLGGTGPDSSRVLSQCRRRSGVSGHHVELFGRIRTRRRRRRERGHQERQQSVPRFRLLLHPRQQVGSDEPVSDANGVGGWGVYAGALQAERSPSTVRRPRSAGPSPEGQAVLLLQL